MFTPMLCDNCGLRSGFSAERAQYIAIKGPARHGKVCPQHRACGARFIGHSVAAYREKGN
jgi:hypothetical protein